jgi:hypothetical protein
MRRISACIHRRFPLLLTFCLAGLVLAGGMVGSPQASAATQEPTWGPNAVRNAGFEQGLRNWSTLGDTPTLSASTAHSGSTSLQMGPGAQGVEQRVWLLPGALYSLTAWGKVVNSSDLSQVTLLMRDGNGKTYRYQMHFSSVDWTWEGQTVLTPARLSSAVVQVQKNAGSGTFYADDISLTLGRDPEIWPFSSKSIWNTPIGSHAVYAPTYIQKEQYVTEDAVYYVNLHGAVDYHTYPLKSPDGNSYTVNGITYGGRCTGTSNYGSVKLPTNLVVPDAELSPDYSTPNNGAGILQPDGRTLVQLQPLARCNANGQVNAYRATETDLYGDGILGSHFGSGLNILGGAIRQGELVNPAPIMHALQLEIWGQKYLYYDPNSSQPGFRWPADREDFYAQFYPYFSYCIQDPCASHPDKNLVQGSLLAIPRNETPASLGLTNPAALKIFQALQDYGGYVVDDSGFDANQIGIAQDALNDIDFSDPTFANDVNTIFAHLAVITNNSPTSIGGGGQPIVAPAPPIFSLPNAIKLNQRGWSATASVNSSDAHLMLDGNLSTGWNSHENPYAGENVIVDMQRQQTFDRIVMDSSGYPYAHVQDYDIFVSNDGVTWTFVTHGSSARVSQITFDLQHARYLKIQSTGGGVNPAQLWAINELEVYRTFALSENT